MDSADESVCVLPEMACEECTKSDPSRGHNAEQSTHHQRHTEASYCLGEIPYSGCHLREQQGGEGKHLAQNEYNLRVLQGVLQILIQTELPLVEERLHQSHQALMRGYV